MKGRGSVEILADALALSREAALAHYLLLCERGLCARSGNAFVLTPAGRSHLAALLAEERSRADPAAVAALYEDFCALDADLKQIVSAWQLKPSGAPNDHADAAYDGAVLARLTELHRRAGPLLRRLARLSPRLSSYGERLTRATERVAAGDRTYVVRILTDSYHTVWFELHEELIALAGLRRDVLARAGTRPDDPKL